MSGVSPRFPVTNAWLTNHAQAYKPRDISSATMTALARKLLEEDKPFHHLLRQCKTRWYLSVLVGQTTLSMDIYLDDPKSAGLISEASYRKRSVFLKVNRGLQFETVEAETVQRLRKQIPATYSIRHLRSSEVAVCDTLTQMLESNMQSHPSPIEDDLMSLNLLSPDMDLESDSPYRDIFSD